MKLQLPWLALVMLPGSIAVSARQVPGSAVVSVPMAAATGDLGAQIMQADQALGASPGEILITASGTISEGRVSLSSGHDLVCENSQITISLNPGSYLYQNSYTEIRNCVISASAVPIAGEIQSVNTNHLKLVNVTFSGGGNLVFWAEVNRFTISDNTVAGITAFNPKTNLAQSGFYLYECWIGEIDNLKASGFVFPAGSNNSGILGLNLSSNITINNPMIQDVDASYLAHGAAGIVIAGSSEITVNGGAITHNANMDGVLSEDFERYPSNDVTITNLNSSYNGAIGRNTVHGALGDGLDLINTGHIHVSNCVLVGNGNPDNQQPGIWIFIDDDVVVENSNISEGSRAGIAIAGSPDVLLINDSIIGNQATGVYVEWQAGTATNVGPEVTFAAGVSGGFGVDWEPGTPFVLEGTTYQIASVVDSGHVILTSSPPDHTSPVQWAVNSTVEILGGVIDGNGLAGYGTQQQDGISLADGTTAVISGVTANDAGAGAQLYALQLAQTASAFLDHDNFAGNVEGGDGITGLTDPVPLVNQPLVPVSLAPGGGGFTTTVNGTGFVPNSVVNWNGVALHTTFVSSAQLTATVPASDVPEAGTASITVVNPAPGGGRSNVEFFDIASPARSINFTEMTTSPAFSGPVLAPIVADFNADGKLDLAYLTSASTNNVVIQLGNGDGSFQRPVTYSAGSAPGQIIVGDWNGDGKLDLVVSDQRNNTTYLLLGNGDGTFQPAMVLSTGPPGAIVAGDFNADGKLDLAVANPSAATVSILLGNGDGTFQAAVPSPTNIPADTLVVGDFNGDGRLDLVVGYRSTVSFLRGNGDGTFQAPVLSPADSGLVGLITADFNGDGKPDLLAADCGGNTGGGGAFILLGNGDGTFQAPVQYAAGRCSVGAVAEDFNADGKLDAVLVNASEGTFSLLLGNGNGTFQNPIEVPAASLATAVVAGDFNGDGRMDTAIAGVRGSSGLVIPFLQGQFPLASLSAASLTFPSQQVGTSSHPQAVTLTNAGNAALALASITITGANADDFAQSNNCPSILPVRESCRIRIAFAPAQSVSATASLSLTDNAPGSRQTVSLAGTTPVFLSPSVVNFPAQYVGSSSPPQTITLTNRGTSTLILASVSTSSQEFSPLSSCGTRVPPGWSCAIGLLFHPTTSGSKTGVLVVADGVTGGLETASLIGTGQDFSLVLSSSSTVTVSPGQTAQYTVAVVPNQGFRGSLTLSCSGAPGPAACAVSPASVTLDGSTPASALVTVATSGTQAGLAYPAASTSGKTPPSLWLVFSGLSGLMLLYECGRGPRLRRYRLLYGFALFSTLSAGITMLGCGAAVDSNRFRTPAGTYNLTVAGTFRYIPSATSPAGGSALERDVHLTLVVQ